MEQKSVDAQQSDQSLDLYQINGIIPSLPRINDTHLAIPNIPTQSFQKAMMFANIKERKTKILCVDDEAFNLIACKYILKTAGLKNVENFIEYANNG